MTSTYIQIQCTTSCHRTAVVCLYCHGGQPQPGTRYSPEGCQKQMAPRCC